ncbi:MAG: dihydroorotase [Gammaproteobacteria bacterium]|nr:dihydroorotase [Gammaproteobacteria bacterium]
MSGRISIVGGRLIDPANGIDGLSDIHIAEGQVVSVGPVPDGFTPDRTIAADGMIVCPGLVDLRAKLREPGQEHKGTIASETRAAAAGGITTLCCPPDTSPVVDTPAVARMIQDRASSAGYARVVPLGALTQGLDGQRLSEMAALLEAGCCGVSNGRRPMASLQVMRRALEYAASFDMTVFIHPEVYELANGGCAHEGAVASRLGLPGIPTAAETVAVAGLLELIALVGVRAHFCLISTARGAQLIARARHDGLQVTADVSAHHLHLSELDVLDFDDRCHLHPPLRTLRDRDGLRQWLAQDGIDVICSDHQPHEGDAKLAPFPSTAAGLSGLETLLPLSLRLVDAGVLSLSGMISRLTDRPARILGVEAGRLEPGMPADVCIFDPEATWTVDARSMLSKGHYTPFMGWEMKGQVAYTLLSGRVVHERGS